MSHISVDNISAMRKSLDQTRDLSRSLSQSLVVAVIDEEANGEDDDVLSFSSHASSFGLRDDGSPATPEGDDGGKSVAKEELLRIRDDLKTTKKQLNEASKTIERLQGDAGKMKDGMKTRDLEIERLTKELQKSHVSPES